VTADELEVLASIAAEVRISFNRARVTAHQWEPAPCPPEWRPARWQTRLAA
jgi:hypothetical protein